MPAEWEPHEATLLTWPHDPLAWERVYDDVQACFAALAARISEAEAVHIAVPPDHMARVRALLEQAGAVLPRVALHPIDSDDTWARDHGPITVVAQGERDATRPPRLMLDWRFNAWGGKFPFQKDDQVAGAFAQALGLPHERIDMVLEGGAIDVNGAGDLLTTRAVLLNTNRAGAALHSPEEKEAILRQRLGVSRIHWLDRGLEGDDTDGHIDDMARFVAPGTVVVVAPDDPDHPDHATMARNRALLAEARGANGPFVLVDLPVPEPLHHDGRMLPASYANFYIANGRVIVPTFAQPADERALGILRELLPQHEVIGLDARPLITQSGAFHCVTQQLPAPP